jgi:hypothetical protein
VNDNILRFVAIEDECQVVIVLSPSLGPQYVVGGTTNVLDNTYAICGHAN